MKKHVLIIEEYRSNVELIDILLESGFEISLLNNVSKFLVNVTQLKPNLIIMNIGLSVTSEQNLFNIPWPELASANIPIIMVSNLSESTFISFPYQIQACIINPPDFDIVRDKALEIIN